MAYNTLLDWNGNPTTLPSFNTSTAVIPTAEGVGSGANPGTVGPTGQVLGILGGIFNTAANTWLAKDQAKTQAEYEKAKLAQQQAQIGAAAQTASTTLIFLGIGFAVIIVILLLVKMVK